MKKLMIAAALLAAGMTAFAQEKSGKDILSELEDKIISERQEKKASAKEGPDIVDFDILAYYSYGWTKMLEGTGFNNKFTSGEHDLNFFIISFNPAKFFSLNAGMGCRWNRFRPDQDHVFSQDSKNVITLSSPSLVSYLTGSEGKASMLKTFALTVPLYVTFRSSELGLCIGADAVFNMNKSTRVINEYWTGNVQYSATQWNGNVKPFYYDLFAQVMFGGLGFYVRFTPESILPGTDGKSLLSMGIRANLADF